MSREEFEKVVARSLDAIPAELGRRLENVALMVEDEPTGEDLEDLGLDPETETLFGQYIGTPLTEQGAGPDGRPPGCIVIYRLPLLEACADRAELVREIRDTVVHEVGHHFGLDEEDLP
jgi:predicted Zn-dependent protease with MMP-like domain